MKRAVALVLLVMSALAACESSTDEPRSTPTQDEAANLPDCESVWQEGATLDPDYEGCKEGGGGWSSAGIECPTDESRALENYGNFWAFRGETIVRFQEGYEDDPDGDPPFQAAFDECVNG